MKFRALILLIALPLAACQTISADGVVYEQYGKRIRVLPEGETELAIGNYFDLNPDCSSKGHPTFRVVGDGVVGKIIFRKETGFANYPNYDERHRCNSTRLPAIAPYYVRRSGHTGSDRFGLEVRWVSGKVWRRDYTIQLR